MGMTSRSVKRVKIRVQDLAATGQPQTLEVVAEVHEIDSGGQEFGFKDDDGWGVRCGSLSVSCTGQQHAFKVFNQLIGELIAATTGTGYDSRF